MFNIIEMLEKNIMKTPVLESKDDKLIDKVYLNPSDSMCYTYDNQPVGSCLKQVWLKKKNKPKSKPIDSYGLFVAASGNIWEDWLIKNYKEMGIFLDNNIKIVSNKYSTSGEIDILHTNPETDSIEVTECKTWTGNNYYAAKEILGNKNILPAPKDAHLLQVVKYLMILKEYNIDVVNIIYIDRSCSNFYNNKQFKVYLLDDEIYYDTFYKNKIHTIHIDRFNVESLIEKDNALIQLLELDYVPNPDYKIEYTFEDIERKFNEGLISKTAYSKVEKNEVLPEDMSDWQCRYCPYGKHRETGNSTCKNIQNIA